MILLIFVTIYFFRKFRTLAESKGYPGTRWGLYGSLVYLGVAFSVQFLMGLLYELGVIDLDLGSTGASFVVGGWTRLRSRPLGGFHQGKRGLK